MSLLSLKPNGLPLILWHGLEVMDDELTLGGLFFCPLVVPSVHVIVRACSVVPNAVVSSLGGVRVTGSSGTGSLRSALMTADCKLAMNPWRSAQPPGPCT